MTSVKVKETLSGERVILGDRCVQEGADWLAKYDPVLERALAETGKLPLRLRSDGFEALLSAIVSQQVSVASAAAIWARIEDAGLTSAVAIRNASEEDLRSVGLSRPKMRYARALAEADLDFQKLRISASEDVMKILTDIPGIGVWTAEIYVMFSLGRADVFPAGDLALQEAARLLFALPERPKEKVMREMAEQWSPWRSVAARLLWAYYRVAKDREGIR